MFRSLRARLTLSYVVVILVCLGLLGLAAWVLLRGYQQELTYSRLQDRGALAARLVGEQLLRGIAPQTAVERLTRQINQPGAFPVFLYLLDAQGRVVAGSNDRLEGQQFEQLALGSDDWAGPVVRGERRLAAGERLLYVADPVRTAMDDGLARPTHTLVAGHLYRPLRLALGDLLPRLVWTGAIALALSVVVAGLMAYSISRPLARIARAAEEISAGNYDQQLQISAPSEVSRLAASFNSMACQVKATLQSQRDFVANVSHDLKTPLTSIQGFSQALLDGTAQDEAARERAAAVIFEEAGRMRRLVEDLLDLARLDAGEVVVAREPVDVAEVLRTSVARFAPQAERAGVRVELQVPQPLPPVAGDADRLGQVFGNLLDNALKHARQEAGEGQVVLLAEQKDGAVVCSVTDNGLGIPAEDLGRIFERFYQVDKSRARRRTGSGLGLAIAQEIVRAHQGQIRAESVKGLGTRFTVVLPT
jgi:signal transduction histidine kinase